MKKNTVLQEALPNASCDTDRGNILGSEPRVYLASDIQQSLGLGRSKTYEFLDETYKTQSPFRVIKVGKLYRVPKKSFDAWLDSISG